MINFLKILIISCSLLVISDISDIRKIFASSQVSSLSLSELNAASKSPPNPKYKKKKSAYNTKKITSRIKENPRLIKEAQIAGKSHQKSIDNLTAKLREGNLNPGIGTKPIGKGILEARARDGARVYFRKTSKGIEILGKSNKANQQKVINEVLKTF